MSNKLKISSMVVGELLNLPLVEEMREDQKLNVRANTVQMRKETDSDDYDRGKYKAKNTINEYLKMQFDHITLPSSYIAYENYSATSFGTIRSKRRSVSFSDTINYVYRPDQKSTKQSSSILGNDVFGAQHAAVYMTLFDNISYSSTRSISTAGTQATASINKCFQVQCQSNITSHKTPSILDSNSSYIMASFPYNENKKIDRIRYSDVYFFGRKRDPPNPDKTGMGKSQPQRPGQTHTMPVNIESKTAQTKKVSGASTGTCTKNVSIKDDKACEEKSCPAIGNSMKGEMMATVSHIKLGPREHCPVHGKEPCQGPKCIVASSGEEQAPVKVSTMTNPRRGVFELVIRRMTRAPLAKNELMLEWTPPPSRPSTCGQPCTMPYSPPVPCRPSKCKLIVCRPSPCQPKGYRKPCGLPCRSVPCSICCKKSCNGKPCRFPKLCRPSRLYKPCSPPRCKPCAPCRSGKPCRPCPPPRKIFKRPCPPPYCRPRKPCNPCPPSPCSQCGSCSPSPCRPSSPCKRCRRCRPCPPYPYRRKVYKPCLPSPCKPCPPSPCRPFILCRPCPPSPCIPCRPSLCSPCPPSPCGSPCRKPCCTIQCSYPSRSSPCLRPCPVRRKKARKCKSLPKIRSRRKRISPCLNRSKCCPVVRCRSVPSPCFGCSPPCPPRKCCSISPFKTLRCCKSSCSSCCT